MGRIPPGAWRDVPGEFLEVGNWMEKKKDGYVAKQQ
jgi:hypothetical protein